MASGKELFQVGEKAGFFFRFGGFGCGKGREGCRLFRIRHPEFSGEEAGGSCLKGGARKCFCVVSEECYLDVEIAGTSERARDLFYFLFPASVLFFWEASGEEG